MGNEAWLLLAVFAVTFVVMRRLDRLGNQLEAVCRLIQLELAEAVHNEKRQRELRDERDTEIKEAAQAQRQAWWTWGIVGAIALAWAIFSKS